MLQLVLFTSLSLIARREGSWWDNILGELGRGLAIIFSLVLFFASLLVLAVFLYLAGLIVVGGKRARFSDALIIALLGAVLSMLFFMFIPYFLIAAILSIITWLLLIKRLYETGWLGSLAVGILAIVIYLAVMILLAWVFGILAILIDRLLSFMVLIP
jgi:ABC-type Na+ efflux pump permease subunit